MTANDNHTAPEVNDEELLKLTLQKIGRNLFNYQLIEKMWKGQVKFSDYSVASKDGNMELITNLDERRSIPMGWLSETHTATIFGKKSSRKKVDEQELKFSASMKIKDDTGELTKRRKQEIRELLEDRNKLVHDLTDMLDAKSPESIKELCRQLDEAHLRISREIQFLNRVSLNISKMRGNILKYLEDLNKKQSKKDS